MVAVNEDYIRGSILNDLLAKSGQYKNKAVLLQSAWGTHAALLDISERCHSAYAERHGMTYWCIRGRIHDRSASTWDRIPLICAILGMNMFEYVFWLDSDTLIIDHSQDLRDALSKDKWLGMVIHYIPDKLPRHLNNGVIYIRNTPEASVYFKQVWDQWSVPYPWAEQSAMHRSLEEKPGCDGFEVVDDRWNCGMTVNPTENPVVMAWHGCGNVAYRSRAMREALSEMEGR